MKYSEDINKKRLHRDIITDLVKSNNYHIIAEIGIERCKMTRSVLRHCGDLINQYWAIEIFQTTDSHERYRPENISEEEWNTLYAYACRLMVFFPQLHVLRMPSLEAVKLFPNRYFDLVFIDSDHRYEPTKNDIEAWLPKVKRGGILSGHDYEIRHHRHSRHHKGVVQAVDETFGSKKAIIGERVWVKEVKG